MTSRVTSNNGHVYVVCSHTGCSKKAWSFDGHDCCGKPWHHRASVSEDDNDDASAGEIILVAMLSAAVLAVLGWLSS